MEGTIHYGFGKEYLQNWGVQEALREIYQNFLDYGEYESHITECDNNLPVIVAVRNGWQPDSLDFLRIGKSEKNKSNAIGKHGEGLKMAFLIMLREGLMSRIVTTKYEIWPEYYQDAEIGECFCLKYSIHPEPIDIPFTIEYSCPAEVYHEFISNVITEDDLIFDDHYFGQIVEKEIGNIYSGNLFVANVDGISRAYNINPAHMQLDRDRSVPRAFDVNYAASKINQSYGKFDAKDTTYNDYQYIDSVPESIKPDFKPRMVGNEIQFTFKNEHGIDQLVTNSNVVSALKTDSFFETAIKKLKKYVAKKLGLYDLLLEFKNKHHLYGEAAQDFELILERVKQ